MNAFDFDNVTAEKAKAMLRYNRLQTVAKLFRFVEICLGLVLLSWISARLPFAVRISGLFFQQLFAVVVSPLFIFLVGNAIVLTLLFKSGKLSGQTPTDNNADIDLYEELIKNRESEDIYGPLKVPPVPEPEQIVYQEKEVISEVNTVTLDSNHVAVVAAKVSDGKPYRRSQSESLKREIPEKLRAKLRRSETEKCRKVVGCGQLPPETVCLVDQLSSEEFQRAVEEFIAKQVKFHQEEKLAIVTC
ncbi:uncharacterized protein LOC127803741 [Diospyros lotus]|uniref:uncharacterized protein LOC127803741 n=1 Tax=Diospyros lotus TaxID=55363 RepID=UPI0022571AD5|nr:uncharacterized protein LOC127803741 [Diospyros lotus]